MVDVIKKTHKRKQAINPKDKPIKNLSLNDWQSEKASLLVTINYNFDFIG